jgi:hypothetical protein
VSSIKVPYPVPEVILNEVAVPAVPPSFHPHAKVSPPNASKVLPAVTAEDTEIEVFSSILFTPSSMYDVTDLKQSPPVTLTYVLNITVGGLSVVL